MTPHEFRKLLRSLGVLTRSQKQRLVNQVKRELSEEKGIELIESRFEQRTCCPHCGCSKLWRWGKAHDLQRYRCRACQRTCNALSSTALARLRYKGRWLTYCACLQEGVFVKRRFAVGLIKPPPFDGAIAS